MNRRTAKAPSESAEIARPILRRRFYPRKGRVGTPRQTPDAKTPPVYLSDMPSPEAFPPPLKLRRTSQASGLPRLETGDEVELPVPALLGTVDRLHIIDLTNEEAEQVETERHARTLDPVATVAGRAAEEARVEVARPGHTGIGEERHFNRE